MFRSRSRAPSQATPGPRALLLGTIPGRLFVAATAVKLLLAAIALVVVLPAAIEVIDSAATLAILATLVIFTYRLVVLVKRRLLWRVRRKLILSYIFIGFVPALLIIGFFLFGGALMFRNLSAYLFKDGYDDIVEDVRVVAQTSALEIGRSRSLGDAEAILDRRRANAQPRYRELSLALVGIAQLEVVHASGPWRHVEPPPLIPEWIAQRGEFAGTFAVTPSDAADEPELLIRAVSTVGDSGARYAVVVDLPVDQEIVERLRDRTGIRAGAISIRPGPANAQPLLGRIRQAARALVRRDAQAPEARGFQQGVVLFGYNDWESGKSGLASISIDVRLRELYARISAAQPIITAGMSLGELFLVFLVVVAVLFVIIQVVALIMGFALARSITSSVHELFMGTERVRQGDFTHRIAVKAQDQLGELAMSFNEMTGSIEQLLQTEAEKKRLEEELRIARQIQMSLLPPGPLLTPGLEVTALCVPAREVGGDYYDFLPLGERRLGVLIADVSGKGTSAALYMAELKGIVLSLSQIYQSPKQLLIEVNRIISDNLDSRSFITMTYAVLDLARGTMTYARAGHTPMIYLPASRTGERRAQVLAPSGLVLGLHLDGFGDKFISLLEEQSLAIGQGDVFVLYTDGVTEAMNSEADLFGDARLSRLVEEHGHLESAELRERILREVEAFVGGADQHDDMTMILIKVEEVGAPRLAEAAVAAHAGAHDA
jgi:sigma-B regulation protein RsbU (phosphoserine phosphatase)